MKRSVQLLLIGCLTLLFGNIQAQDSLVNPAKWNFKIVKWEQGHYTIAATASIDNGWGVFAPEMSDDFPNTRVAFDSGVTVSNLQLKSEGNTVKEKNSLLEADVQYFKSNGTVLLSFDAAPNSLIKGALKYMAFKADNFTNPIDVPFKIKIDASGAATLVSAELAGSTSGAARIKRNAIDVDHPTYDVGGTGAEGKKSLWSIFLLGIAGGLLALVMPCTFPMIPMTVSFFTKKATDPKKGIRNAFLYGFFIFLIYVIISVPFYFLEAGNAAILNNIATNAWLNLFFAAIFLVFALSFFGLYEIGLPSSIANKVDSKGDMGSIGGIFFMAMTLAIVSFSCTGPILGTLLVGALTDNGGAIQLTVALAGFGIALGLPFGLFALFPRFLNSLPRSGSWMNTVKIVFAFIELALMIKFISNADLVEHWGILKRETFFAIWIAIALATSLYLFGVLKFSYDPPPPKLSLGRKILATIFLIFALYMVPGLTNTKYANLSLISGFPPPLSYSWYGKKGTTEGRVEPQVVNDYEAALALAKKENKRILIDFTGWACVNCRKMEENVWTDPEVKEIIEKKYILLSLYVDDRSVLKDEDQFLYTNTEGAKVPIKTVGDLYSTFQSENFKNASQPLYAVITADENLITKPVGYTPNVKEYKAWLEQGLK